MRKAILLAAASALILSACQQERASNDTDVASEPSASSPTTTETEADASAPELRTSESADDLARRPDMTPAPIPGAPGPIARIAYAYSYGLSLPRDRGAEMMSRHEQTCALAGPAYCQVVSSRADWIGREPGGRLELRGQPDWINRFRAGLALDAFDAGGRLEASDTSGEDVTRQIDTQETGVQTDAMLLARIRELQARRGGTMEQRLEVERELADLQRGLDAGRIELRTLNDRVETARLTIDYRQGGVMAADNPLRPVGRSLADSFGMSMQMLAILITTGSVLLPVAVIGGLVWFAFARRRRRTPSTTN